MAKKKKSSFAGITSGNLLKRKSGVNLYVLGTIAVALAGVGVYLTVFSHAGTNAPLLVDYTTGGPNGPLTSMIGTVDPTTNAVTSLNTANSNIDNGGAHYSPDYSKIAWTSYNFSTAQENVTFYDVTTKKASTVALPGKLFSNDMPVQWLPDGSGVVVAAGPSTSSNLTNIYIVKNTGAAVTKVANVNATVSPGIQDIAVSGNGTYIAYRTMAGIFAVKPGSKPVTMYAIDSSTTNCSSLVARPQAAQEFAYSCNVSTLGTTKSTSSIIRQKVGGKQQKIVVANIDSNVGGTYYGDMSWSSDGTKLAVQAGSFVYVSDCNDTLTNKVVSVTAAGVVKTLATSTPQTGTGCRGGGAGLGKTITWNALGSTIAYMDTTLNGTNVLDEIKSTGGPNNPKTAVNVSSVSSVNW